MFILDRLVSRSSRSLAVMTGYAQSGSGRGWGEARGRPSIASRAHVLSPSRITPFQQFPRFQPAKERPWTVEPS